VRSDAVALALTAASVAGCGGMIESPPSDGGAAESSLPFIACGGDLVGTWAASHTSLIRAPVPSRSTNPCAWRVVTWAPEAQGQVTFGSDGVLTSTMTLAQDQTVVVPEACWDASDCQALQGMIAPQGGATSALCVGSRPSECTCHLVVAPLQPKQVPVLEVGYSVDDGGLSVGWETPGHSGLGPPMPYCVRGDTLSWVSTATNGEVVLITATR
jgi:hypothetical protein